MAVGEILAVGNANSNKITDNNNAELGGLGQDAFMKLLLAQLKNQDPLQPMNDTEFVAQLAQFNSLSELYRIDKTLSDLLSTQSLLQGSALIGKTISGLADDGSSITGLVDGLHITEGKMLLDVNGVGIPLDRVQSVTG